MNDDEALARKAQEIENTGVGRYGEKSWRQSIAAISRVPGINTTEVVREVAKQADPAGYLFAAGREVLINEATNGDGDAERIYSQMRREEREAHWASKGRVR
jgi:hypothetical protein